MILNSFLGVLSIIWLRRILYEIFSITHRIMALAVLSLLWSHIKLRFSLSTICLSIITVFWALEKILWVIFLVYRNSGSGLRNSAARSLFPSTTSQIAQVRVSLRRPMTVFPGQYVYITIPTVPHMLLGFFQAHPYMIAWSSNDNGRTEIVLLISVKKGFSRAITYYQEYSHVMVDGPYGNSYHFNKFDKVLFMASGIGIAAHLVPIRYLIRAHNERSARVRRISLMWMLEKDSKAS